MRKEEFVLASDIGGSHITSAIVSTKDWTILQKTVTRNPVNSNLDAKSIFSDWSSNIQSCLDKTEHEVTKIGIAMPGPFDYEHGISLMTGQTKYDSIYKLEVIPRILENLSSPIDSILFINDAAAFLQGEVFAQHLDHENRILGITLGTGLGSAVWTNGQNAFDADLWNSPYQESIFEEHLVTRWFTKRFHELTDLRESGLKEILENHREHPALHTLLSEYNIHLHNFMDYFSKKHNCNNFIIGGNITKAWDTILGSNRNQLNGYNVQLGKHPEYAAIIGAASLYKKEKVSS